MSKLYSCFSPEELKILRDTLNDHLHFLTIKRNVICDYSELFQEKFSENECQIRLIKELIRSIPK